MPSLLTRVRRRILLLVTALLVGLFAQGVGAQSQIQEITIRITDAGVEAPAQANAGLTTLIVENATGEPQGVAIARLKPGKTMEELQAAFQQENEAAIFALLEFSGAVPVHPNGRNRVVLTLLEGMNLVAAQAGGEPKMMQVMAATGPAAPEPTSNLSASLRDYAISLPSEIQTGKQTWKITNQGPQTHELLYARIAPGKTFEDVVAAVQAEGPPSGPPPIEEATFGGLGPMSPTLNAWIEADLQPGNYVAVCFLPDQATGKPHAALGMITPFRVTAAQMPLPATGVEAAPLTFPETGYSLSGELLSFWNANGGLQVFGMPLNEARQVNGQVGQLFERARVELHPRNAAPYNVQLGLLGVEVLAKQGRAWETFPKADRSTAHYSPETGHAIAAQFWDYYRSHGLEFDGRRGTSAAESLALFGYPISPAQIETNASGDRVLTQWFQRARFEYHADNPAKYRVLLGRLGAELQAD